MTLLNTLNVGGTEFGVQSSLPMGTCATPAGTEIKAAVFADDFELSTGNLIAVTFTYANTYGNGSTTYPKLTINGANYPIVFPTGEYAGSGAWANGQIITFMYDGANLVMTSVPKIQTTDQVTSGSALPVTSGAVATFVNGVMKRLTSNDYSGNCWIKLLDVNYRYIGQVIKIILTAQYSGLYGCSHEINVSLAYAGPTSVNSVITDLAKDLALKFTKIRIYTPSATSEKCSIWVYYGQSARDNIGFTFNFSSTSQSVRAIPYLTEGTPPEDASYDEYSLGTNGFYINGENRLPAAPTTDGAYNLKCTVTNGVPTYSWT